MKSLEHMTRATGAIARQRGLTLVELMVSLAIGMFLVIGATTVYLNSRKSSEVDEAYGRLQETARYAMSVIEPDIRMANFWGLAKNGAGVVNKPTQTGAATPSSTLVGSVGSTANSCGATYAVDTEKYIEGTDASYGPGCAAKTGVVALSDTLTIRRGTTTVAALNANKLQLCSGRNSVEIIRNTTCSSPSEIHDLLVTAYYVDMQSNLDANSPSLRRKSLGVNAAGTGPGFQDVEIVSGVEDIQVQFGWEPTGASGDAVQYLNPGNALLATGQIVSVRLWIMVRAENPDGAYSDETTWTYANRSYKKSDGYRRLLVSRTIFIRNTMSI